MKVAATLISLATMAQAISVVVWEGPNKTG